VESVRFLASLIARIGFAAGISYPAYRLGGNHKYGLVMLALTAPLWGVLLRKPILEGISAYFQWVKKQP
jgi:hypothetical protein